MVGFPFCCLLDCIFTCGVCACVCANVWDLGVIIVVFLIGRITAASAIIAGEGSVSMYPSEAIPCWALDL